MASGTKRRPATAAKTGCLRKGQWYNSPSMAELEQETIPLREGLPPSYRMRADAHYVDQLTARTPDVPHPAVAPDKRRIVEVDIMTHVMGAIATIQSAANLASDDGSPAVRRVALDLIRAAAWRGAGQVRRAPRLGQKPPS